MKKLIPAFECVTPGQRVSFLSCNPCSPDEVRGGSQCNPCNPCSPDQIRGGSQCNPCNPCSPDQLRGGSNCFPCNPCSPDEIRGGSQCNPCNPCSPDQMSGGSSGTSSSGCFISSACVKSKGLPDNCEELQTLRAFRDAKKAKDPAFLELVNEYYRIAPAIVEKIDSLSNAKDIYQELYINLVCGCVALIKDNKEDEAVVLYTNIVRELQNEYL